MSDHDEKQVRKVSRRGLLTAGGAAFAGAAGGIVLGRVTAPDGAVVAAEPTPRPQLSHVSPAAASAAQTIDFYGVHQAGVDTPEQTYATFLGLNLIRPSAQDADSVLRIVSDDAARLMAGRPSLGDTEPELAEIPARLSFTIGLGHSLFEKTGRFDRIPAYFPAIPAFSTDDLDDRWSSTDFYLQIASDDPLTLAHAQRMVVKALSTLTAVAWYNRVFARPLRRTKVVGPAGTSWGRSMERSTRSRAARSSIPPYGPEPSPRGQLGERWSSSGESACCSMNGIAWMWQRKRW